MIESNVIKWLDFGDSVQSIDAYSKKGLLIFFKFFREMVKNKYFPIAINIFCLIIFFIQIWTMAIILVSSEGDLVLEILDYLKKVTIFYEIITNFLTYKEIFIIIICMIFFDCILIILSLLFINKINISLFILLINLLNVAIYYYFIGPITNIFLISIWCENGIHKFLGTSCYSNPHLFFFIMSLIILILSILISFIYAFYCNEIELITINLAGSLARINCNYEIFCLLSKIFIFFFGFFVRKNDVKTLKIIYEAFILLICLIMSIYLLKNVYYYNSVINYLNFFGWFFSAWFSFCILLKTVFQLECITNLVIIGWIIIAISLYKTNKMKIHSLITEDNTFEFKDNKSIEMYKNILLNLSRDKNSYESKLLIYGIVKKFEEYAINNPEINYQYHKLLNDNYLTKKYNKEDDLPILSIIYIIYSFYLEKSTEKEEITFHMCYFLINNLNNPTFAMFLCSKLKNGGHKSLYYKYLLIEDIKEYLIYKLNKNSNKESIKHVQIGSVILYYLYIYLFKLKIYDAISNQVEYIDLLKNSITTNKTTDNFLKSGKIILKIRKEITTIWEKIIELNPFSDDCQKDYILYLDTILQDELLSREESKKYMLLKNNKYQEKNNIYHNMFLMEKSCVLLIDGYLSNGKILYASQNFSLLFMYNAKELLNVTCEDLLPNVIQTFHKELVIEAIKYSNITHLFKMPKDSLLKNKNGGLFNIKLFVKPVPNLDFGLIYYSYIQKNNEDDFEIILDKDLKINGYTEMSQTGSTYTISNGFDLSPNIIGHHIGTIIPDIFPLLEYKNDEINITKKNYELKGYLYPVEKIDIIKNKIDIILAKIKTNKFNENNNQGEIDNDANNINNEYKDLITELTNQKIKFFSIFYKIKLFSFLDGKYKYYRIYITNDIISNNESEPLVKKINEQDELKNNKNESKTSLSIKSKKEKKVIYRLNDKKPKLNANDANDNENTHLTLNGKNNDYNDNNNLKIDFENKDKSNKNINYSLNQENKGKKNINYNESMSYDSNPQNNNSFNKLKNDIINQKEAYPIKIMVYLGFALGIIGVIFMLFDITQVKSGLSRMVFFLDNNLYFNNTKIICASLYIIGVNIKWGSHSLYLNKNTCINGDFISFNLELLNKNIDFLQAQKKEALLLGKDFKKILSEKHIIGLNVYKSDTEKYKFNLDNILTFLINTGIKIIDTYDEYYPDNCANISKDLGLSGINVKNLIEISYYIYNSSINGFTGEEKRKRLSKNSNPFPISFLIFGVICIIIFFFYIHYILSLHNIEIYFLERLINFNSTNFDNYIKRIDEIKKKLRNDNNEDEEKGDELEFNELDSKKKEEEEGFEGFETKQSGEIEDKRKKTKKKMGKQSKIAQQRKKKLKTMKTFFTKSNLLFGIKIIIIMVAFILYYIISMILNNNYIVNYKDFDTITDSLFATYKDSFSIFLKIKKELEIYENSLINCEKIGDFEKMDLPKINEIEVPTLGNLILKITQTSDLKHSTLEKFQLLYNEDSCKLITFNEKEYDICVNFWAGVLLKGIEQSIIHMGVVISSSIDEIQYLNDIRNNKTLYNLIGDSSFIYYEQFMEYYLLRAFNQTNYIIREMREQKLDGIINKVELFLFIYIIISIVLFILSVYNTFVNKNLFNSFLNFICILPSKFIAEDENFYEEIIKFGEKYF